MTKARDNADNWAADITGVTAGTGITGGGTSGAVTVNLDSAAVIAPTIVDAKGDLIVASAADTVLRVPVGTNEQVLTADSATTSGVKWATPSAGAYTVISTTSMSGSATIDLTSIPQTYRDLFVTVTGHYVSAGGYQARLITNNQTESIYTDAGFYFNDSGQTTQFLGNRNFPNFPISGRNIATTSTAGNQDMVFLYLRNYTSAAYKTLEQFGINDQSYPWYKIGAVRDTAAISRLQFTSGGGGNFLGGTLTLYGVK